MNQRYPTLYASIYGLSLLAVLLGSVVPSFLAAYSLLPAVGLILFMGIPHGATDHLIFAHLHPQVLNRGAMVRFYVYYLGLIGLYALIWWLSPLLGLSIFLVVSAFHFGQSNWNYLPRPGGVNNVLFLLWGSYVIAAPVLLDPTASWPILTTLLHQDLPSWPDGWRYGLLGGLFLLNVGSIIALVYGGQLSRRQGGWELAHLLLLSLLFATTPLLLGFALYFAAWHSLSSMADQIAFFREKNPHYPWWKYGQEAAPYTILALLGLLGLWWWQTSAAWNFSLSNLFLFISLVTLPHMTLIHLLYIPLEQRIKFLQGMEIKIFAKKNPI